MRRNFINFHRWNQFLLILVMSFIWQNDQFLPHQWKDLPSIFWEISKKNYIFVTHNFSVHQYLEKCNILNRKTQFVLERQFENIDNNNKKRTFCFIFLMILLSFGMVAYNIFGVFEDQVFPGFCSLFSVMIELISLNLCITLSGKFKIFQLVSFGIV